MGDTVSIIIGISILFGLVLLVVFLTKEDKKKTWDRKQKEHQLFRERKRMEEELENERIRKEEASRQYEEEIRRRDLRRSAEEYNRKAAEKRRIEEERNAEEKLNLLKKEKRNQNIHNVGYEIGKAIGMTSKFIGDSTQKYKNKIEININKHYLTSFSWVWVGFESYNQVVTFLENNELLVTTDGIAEKWNYELISQNNSILITHNGVMTHYNMVNVNNDYFFLNKVSTMEVIAFVNQNKYEDANKQWFMYEAEKLKKSLKK